MLMSYQVEVIWVPSGWVSMLEQAYSLLSGLTRIGLIDSWLQPRRVVLVKGYDFCLSFSIYMSVLPWKTVMKLKY